MQSGFFSSEGGFFYPGGLDIFATQLTALLFSLMRLRGGGIESTAGRLCPRLVDNRWICNRFIIHIISYL